MNITTLIQLLREGISIGQLLPQIINWEKEKNCLITYLVAHTKLRFHSDRTFRICPMLALPQSFISLCCFTFLILFLLVPQSLTSLNSCLLLCLWFVAWSAPIPGFYLSQNWTEISWTSSWCKRFQGSLLPNTTKYFLGALKDPLSLRMPVA